MCSWCVRLGVSIFVSQSASASFSVSKKLSIVDAHGDGSSSSIRCVRQFLDWIDRKAFVCTACGHIPCLLIQRGTIDRRVWVCFVLRAHKLINYSGRTHSDRFIDSVCARAGCVRIEKQYDFYVLFVLSRSQLATMLGCATSIFTKFTPNQLPGSSLLAARIFYHIHLHAHNTCVTTDEQSGRWSIRLTCVHTLKLSFAFFSGQFQFSHGSFSIQWQFMSKFQSSVHNSKINHSLPNAFRLSNFARRQSILCSPVSTSGTHI